ncbi:Coiled-coil domain-containing protein 3 [Saguinus oedipus]|uniref:Coiled-coil domain-containing protein 3 n=1 Tax=Saguinus oedipus TaxID=9490 RepID=A0ABQ9V8V9_SAGOE|nr:Coiled-coil domain-containing protein 3 [Saguinus oedipus]
MHDKHSEYPFKTTSSKGAKYGKQNKGSIFEARAEFAGWGAGNVTLLCSSVQKALFEEEDHVKKLQQKVATLEKRNRQLRERVKKVKRSLRQARKKGRHLELANQKLSEKLAVGALPHINAPGPVRAPYLRG